MNLKSKTTPQWFDRASLLLVGAALVGATASADPSGSALTEEAALLNAPAISAPAAGSLREALQGGKYWVNLRYRFETVDPGAAGAKEGRASTLRTRLGYETGEYKGLTGTLEFSDVTDVPGTYNDDHNDGSGNSTRPVIKDPNGTVANQVFLKYAGAMKGNIKIGRQRIKLGNDRFIGNVGWRQTEMTYDAIRYSAEYGGGISVDYAYLDRSNKITAATEDQNSHILNVGKAWENVGTLTAYGYLLDFDETQTNSCVTIGASFAGSAKVGTFSALYRLEYAVQKDSGNNPNDLDASYSHAYLGAKVAGFTAKAGFESLEGSPGGTDAGRSFRTPLATAHAFNGWADQFLAPQAAGLEDMYLEAGYGQGPVSGALIYHTFGMESASGDYGTEVDAVVKYKVNADLSVGLKAADFSHDTSSAGDVQKIWLWLAYGW